MTSVFQIVSLQLEKLLMETSIRLHDYVSLLFESFVEIKIKIESRLHCIDLWRQTKDRSSGGVTDKGILALIGRLEANNIPEPKTPDPRLRDQNQDYQRYCSTCSGATSVSEPKSRVIYHIHNSSLQYRIPGELSLHALHANLLQTAEALVWEIYC